MKKLEKDYAAMKTKEQEEMVELRVSLFNILAQKNPLKVAKNV